MARWLKRGMDTGATKAADAKVRETVESILADIDARKDQAVKDLSKKFDEWAPTDFKLSAHEIERAIAQVPQRDLDDIKFAQAQVRNFAQKQKETMHDLEVETLPGVVLATANPGELDWLLCARRPLSDGRLRAYVHRHGQGRRRRAHHRLRAAVQGRPASGHRSRHAFRRRRRNLRARRRASGGGHGARHREHQAGRHDRRPRQRLCGGGQAPTVRPRRHRPAGRSDRDLDHRRRQRGRRNLRYDLLGQAEHGPTSPAVMITNSEKLARDTMAEVERLLKILPTADAAGQAWKDYGEAIVCDDLDEMVREADRVASEHVQVMTRDPDFFLNNMKNYGSLFLGPRTNVAYGDKVIGTNHTLPTKKAARYTGGLWVGKFMKTCTYQKVLTDEASALIGEVCSRLCVLGGIPGARRAGQYPRAPLRRPQRALRPGGRVTWSSHQQLLPPRWPACACNRRWARHRLGGGVGAGRRWRACGVGRPHRDGDRGSRERHPCAGKTGGSAHG